jgi:hypothetical protein
MGILRGPEVGGPEVGGPEVGGPEVGGLAAVGPGEPDCATGALLAQAASAKAAASPRAGAASFLRSVTRLGRRGSGCGSPQISAWTRSDHRAATISAWATVRPGAAVGRLADLTIWDRDPATAPADVLGDLNPTHTVIGGRLVHGSL